MLNLKDIKKDYKIASGAVHALKGVSLCLRKSEFVCILGPSGCGKTTLLNIIGGLDHYTSGDLIIQGKSTKDFKDRDWDVYRNHRIGFVFQSYNLIPHQTVLSNVELALTIAGMGREERKKRAAEALERVGLGSELDKKPNQLSGGQMQRVAIARALVNDPDILLADEPTGALDSKTSVQIMDLMQEIARERLVVMVTHNPELAEQYATRIVRLHDGLVEADSDPYSEEEEAAEGTLEEEEELQASVAEEESQGERQPQEREQKRKKLRAKMGFMTSLALSARNLLTKKGRTIITSIAGSIGIISVCLVLALSSGFNTYIKRTEEDMLSYYPLEITESTFDLTAVMSAMSDKEEMPDMEKIGDRVYVDSFLTGLAKGITVQNDISKYYIKYIEEGKEKHPEWFSAIQYSYGAGLVDNLFTSVDVGGETAGFDAETRYYSLSELKQFYIKELRQNASQYNNLVPFADFFGDIVNKMPGTEDYASEDYGKFVLSQYDVIAGEFPMEAPAAGEREGAVLVIGNEANDVTDLVLAQLGLIPEENFLKLFDLGKREGEEVPEKEKEERLYIPFEDTVDEHGNVKKGVLHKRYTMYFNDEVYTENPDYNGFDGENYPFTYNGQKTKENWNSFAEGQGIDLEVKAVLRLKDGYTYGCLKPGLNLTEATVNKYIRGNMQSKIVQWMNSKEAKVPTWFSDLLGEYSSLSLYLSPASHLDSQFVSIDLDSIRAGFAEVGSAIFSAALAANPTIADRQPAGTLKATIVNMGTVIFNEVMKALPTVDAVKGTPFEDIPEGTAERLAEETIKALDAYDPDEIVYKDDFLKLLGSLFVKVLIEDPNNVQLKGSIYITYEPNTIIRYLGGNDTPNGINLYPTDFDSKEKVLEYLDAWNDMCEPGEDGKGHPLDFFDDYSDIGEDARNYILTAADKIKYTDRVGLLMGMVQTMLDVITYVLVAFTAISLVVSSVMIGIITYVSVVERVKEIGVLRSLGASKRDIKNLFNAETFIIGLSAGVFGVAVTYIFTFVISAIIESFTGIAGIAALQPLTAFIMICVSVALTLISGLIPAAKAAKKDPVIALRTE